MKRVLADARAFGSQYLRSRVGAFFALIFPIILILLFGAIFSGSESTTVTLHVQDLDDTPFSHAFIEALRNTTVLDIQSIPSDIAITDYIRTNSINTALRIPADFSENITRYAGGDLSARVNVTLFGDPTQSSYGIALATVNGVATGFNFGIVGASPVVGMVRETIVGSNLKYIDFFLPGVVGLTILTTPLFGMTSVCAEYRTRKYFKFLATTTLTKGEWLLAKIIFYSLLMLASLALMFVISTVVWGASVVLTPTAILFVVAGTIEFTSLGMVLGLYVRDVETAAAVANAIGFPMMFLAGSFFPIDSMPTFLQSIARVLPLTYVNEGLRATMVFGNEGTALTYLGITAVLGVVFFAIPARALSWKSK